VAKPCSGINDSHLPSAGEFRYISGMGHLLGYARVSTAGDQDVALQRDALTAAGCYRVFVDTASGALDTRPALTEVLDQLRPEDTLVVWRLDRLGRSIRHLIDFLADLETRGIGFRSLTETIDTTSPGGRLVFHLFAALAQFERELIKERTNAGPGAWPARGPPSPADRRPGQDRPTVVRPEGAHRRPDRRSPRRQPHHDLPGVGPAGRPGRHRKHRAAESSEGWTGQDMTRHGRLDSVSLSRLVGPTASGQV